jgi:hypothetical protein
MKKLTLSALTVLLISATNAQFSKGDRYLTGSFSAIVSDNETNSERIKSYGISFAPAIVKFKSEKKASGFKLLAGFHHGKNTSGVATSKSDMFEVGGGLFWQNYVLLNKGFYLVLEHGVNGRFGRTEGSSNPGDYSYNNTSYGAAVYLSPGLGYKLSERLIIGLNFSHLASAGYSFHRSVQTNGGVTYKSSNGSFSVASSVNNTSVGNLGITFGWKLK